MAIKNKKDKNEVLAIALQTQKNYCALAHQAYKTGKLDNLTDNQVDNLDFLEKFGYIELTPKETNKGIKTVRAISDSNRSTFKVPMVTANLAHTPIKEMNNTAQQLLDTVATIRIMKMLLKKRTGRNELYADMMTLSFRNVSMDREHYGNLRVAFFELKDMLMELKEALRKRKTFSEYGHFLAMVPSFETTLNKEAMEKMSGKNLFHPHVHVLMFYDEETNGEALRSEIWKIWKKIAEKHDRKVSKKAFGYENSYNPEDAKNEKAALIGSILEAQKYAMKPNIVNEMMSFDEGVGIASKRKEFNLDVFSEIYNVYVKQGRDNHSGSKSKFQVNSSGLFREAKMYVNKFKKVGLFSALVLKACDGDISSIPTLMSQVQTYNIIDNDKMGKKYHVYFSWFSDVTKLTRKEMLYYNRSVLSGSYASGFDEKMLLHELREHGKLDPTRNKDEKELEKQRIFFWLLKEVNIPRSPLQIMSVIGDWANAYKQEIINLSSAIELTESKCKFYANSQLHKRKFINLQLELTKLKKSLKKITNDYHDVMDFGKAYEWAVDNCKEYSQAKVHDYKAENEAAVVREIAKKANMTEKDIEVLQKRALLHDDERIWKFLKMYVQFEYNKELEFDSDDEDSGFGVASQEFWMGERSEFQREKLANMILNNHEYYVEFDEVDFDLDGKPIHRNDSGLPNSIWKILQVYDKELSNHQNEEQESNAGSRLAA